MELIFEKYSSYIINPTPTVGGHFICNYKVPMKRNLGCRFVVSHERPINTENNAVYRFLIFFSFQSYKGLKMATSA